MIGQVFSVRLFFIRSAMPSGVLVGGILSEMWGVRALYLIIGAIICHLFNRNVTSVFQVLDEAIEENSLIQKFKLYN